MTTIVSRDDVLHLAQLSNLQLADDEIGSLQSELTSILDYVTQLSELDTSGVEPTYQVTDLENITREDVVMAAMVTREQLLATAPEQIADQIKVPKVL